MKHYFCSCLQIFALCSFFINYSECTVTEIPNVDKTKSIDVYFLAAPFPINAPSVIRQHVGSGWDDFALTHCGLGFELSDSDKKWSIELTSSSYVGSVIPADIIDNTTLVWDNAATIVLTHEINASYWTEAVYLGSMAGFIYNDYARWINEQFQIDNIYYQPIQVVSPDTDELLASYLNSYSFVSESMTKLAAYGIKMQSMVSLTKTSLYYSATSVAIVEEDLFIIDYFSAFSSCMQSLVEASTTGSDIISGWPSCMTNPSYLFFSEGLYLEVQLSTSMWVTATSSPLAIPKANDRDTTETMIEDYIAVAFLVLMVLGSILAMYKTIVSKTSIKSSSQFNIISRQITDRLYMHEMTANEMEFRRQQMQLLSQGTDDDRTSQVTYV